jgi:hypothetical protein
MRRIAFILACLCLFAVPALSVDSPADTPAWHGLDHKVTASYGPITVGCFEKCTHAGQGGVCVPIGDTWMCGFDESGGCHSTHVCF